VISSPFLRCYETASSIAAAIDTGPIKIDYGVTEFMHSNWFPENPHDNLQPLYLGLQTVGTNNPPQHPETPD
jgi:broad specificity phosphatase PhoE